MALIASATVAGANGGTTSNIDTSAANFLVAYISSFAAATMADSLGNTWTALTAITAVDPDSRIFYVQNPTVGASHNFTGGGASTFQVLCVEAHSGMSTSAVFVTGQQSGASGAGFDNTNAQPGSLTPPAAGALIVCGFGDAFTQVLTINESMTITNQTQLVGGNNYSGAMAHKYQGAAAAINPLWNFTGTAGGSIVMATFAAATAAVTGPPRRHRPSQLLYR